MSKIYFYALDRRNGNLVAALSCPDKDTAFRAFQEASNKLEGTEHGGGYPYFEYDWREIDWSNEITYKPYTEPSYWLPSWFKKHGETSHLVVAKYDAEDFALAELQTKKSFLGIKGRYHHELEDYIWFMYYINLAVQRIVNEIRPTKIVKSIEPIEERAQPPIFIAASEKKKNATKKSALEAYNESKPLEEPPDEVIIKGIDHAAATVIEKAVFQAVFNAQARFKEPTDEVEIEKIHRLHNDGWTWREIQKQIDPNTKQEDIDSEINRLKMRYSREYGKPRE